MKCSKCGKIVGDNHIFCKNCGAKINEDKMKFHHDVLEQNTLSEVKTDTITKGCKVWFWMLIIMNTFSALSSSTIYTMALSIVIAVGSGMIIFKYKKVGLYMILGAAILGCFVNIAMGIGVLYSVFFAIPCPVISYYFVNKNSNIIK